MHLEIYKVLICQVHVSAGGVLVIELENVDLVDPTFGEMPK